MDTTMIIESIGVYLPEHRLTTDEVVKGCARPLVFPLEQFTGIRNRHVAAEHEFSIDLARLAVTDCLRRSRWAPDQIDLLLCCNIARLDGPMTLSLEPSTSARLACEMGLQPTLAFDINNACAGMFTGLYVAELFLKRKLVRNALVVSGEHITPLIRTAQREIDGFLDPRIACLTVGDAGAALLVEPTDDPAVGFHELDLYTLGRYSPYCIAKLSDREPAGPIMLTDAARLTAVSVTESIAHAIEIQRRGNWSADRIQHLIPHQTSKTSMNDGVREAERALGAGASLASKVVSVVEECGNTATTSHSVALMEAIRGGRIRSGERIEFRISASGLTVGAAHYTLDDLPDRVQRDQARTSVCSSAGTPKSTLRRAGRRVRIAASAVVERGVSRDDSFTLATSASKAALASWGGDASRIGLVLHAGVHRTDFLVEPAVATLVAGRLHINDAVRPDSPHRTLAFDVLNGSVGFLNACELATHFLEAGSVDAALVTTAEVGDKVRMAGSTSSGLLECGSAIVLEPSNGHGFGAFAFRTLPEHQGAFVSAASYGETCGSAQRHIDATWLDPVLQCMPELVNELLANESCSLGDVKWVVAPPLSPRFLGRLADKVRIPLRHFIDVGDVRGDWYTSLLPRAFDQLAQHADTQPNDLALILSAGSGLSVGCATYYF